MPRSDDYVRVAEYVCAVRFWPESGYFTSTVTVRTDIVGDGYYRAIPATRDPNVIYEDLAEDVGSWLNVLLERMSNQLPLF